MPATITHRGRTTIWWGTDNIALSGGNSNLASALCESASFAPISDRVKVPGNQGATALTSTIKDGEKADVTFFYETNNANVSFPDITDIISLKKPGGNTANYEVTDAKIDAKDKDHARIVLSAERHYDINI